MPPSILTIVGPTGSGKTALGLQLARERNAEVISADSRQVYRFLSVGTAKPAGRWEGDLYRVEGVPYHLVDMTDPKDRFSAAEFVVRVTALVKAIRGRGREPILAGGTGFYLAALAKGLAPLPPADIALRARLRETADRLGRPALHAALARVDPEAAASIPANHISRLIRALEVHELTGKPISQWHREHRSAEKAAAPIELDCIGLAPDHETFNVRLETRCREMLNNGMVEETQDLLRRGYSPDCPALTGLGYPRVVAHLRGELSKEETARLLIQDTRQYVKRQMTWFRNQLPVTWKK